MELTEASSELRRTHAKPVPILPSRRPQGVGSLPLGAGAVVVIVRLLLPPPRAVVFLDPTELGLAQPQHGPDGLEHVVAAGQVLGEHVVEHHVFQVL